MGHPSCRALGALGLVNRHVGLMIAAATICLSSGAMAQSATIETSPPQTCQISAFETESPGEQELFADCSGVGLLLGRATSHTVTTNDALGAQIIDITLHTDRHIWLLSQTEDGSPVLEDIGGQVALAAGLGPMGDVTDVPVDLGSFADDGSIAVLPDTAGSTDMSVPQELQLDDQILSERAR